MESISQFIISFSDWLWGGFLIVILMVTHVFLTLRLGFIQRHLLKGIRLTISKEKKEKGDISPFSALMTALAATIGTGNIVGVATAVALGGPGAVLWMWFTGVFGIATKYAESLLSVHFRIKNADGSFSGGPMYVIERGLHCKWLAAIFSLLVIISSFGIGASVQSNSFSAALQESIGSESAAFTWITATVLTLVVGVIILNGLKGVSRICKALVPLMGFLYVVGCIVLLVLNYQTLPSTLRLIITSAFDPEAAGGGFVGLSIVYVARYGVARGLFSNESGMGSAPIIAASAQTNNPVRQALVSATGTFWDTVVICALTGLVIVNSGQYADSSLQGMQITKAAFRQIPFLGDQFICIALITFSFSTLLGWYIYAEKSAQYLFGNKSILPYRICFLLSVFAGCIMSINVVWSLGDIFNGLMAIPNLISLLVLSPLIVKLTKKYIRKC
ncbi:MAG: sodium:alanine symporter family protein [Paludibacteraceae bacterium]|nr:sodium:alanine symporter family protein [Paludibacteraceae bacterium]